VFAFGSGVLQGFRTDIANGTPVNFGLANDITLDWSFDLKEGYGQFQHPVVLARGKAKVTAKAKVLRVSGIAFGNFFFGISPVAGQVATAFAEAATITGGSATVANSANFVDDLGVVKQANGLPMAKVGAAPAVGQYSVAAGVYTFNVGDNNTPVLISYTYNIAGSGQKIVVTNQLMGFTPTFQSNLFTTFQGNPVTLKLPNCASTKLAFPTKLDDYTMPEFDYSIYADATGAVGTWSFAETS
jgi:hypothetical protein